MESRVKLTNEDKTRLLAEAVGICTHPREFRKSETVEDGNDSDTAYWCEKCGKDYLREVVPAFLTDANAALTLVEFAKRRGWTCEFTNDGDGKNLWDCVIENEDHAYGFTAPTLPIAIAHAFARAFNLQGNWEDDL